MPNYILFSSVVSHQMPNEGDMKKKPIIGIRLETNLLKKLKDLRENLQTSSQNETEVQYFKKNNIVNQNQSLHQPPNKMKSFIYKNSN